MWPGHPCPGAHAWRMRCAWRGFIRFTWALRAGCPRHVAAASRRRPCVPCGPGILARVPMLGECALLGAGSCASHGYCGQRHAATACRETRQPRHVPAASRRRPWEPRLAARSRRGGLRPPSPMGCAKAAAWRLSLARSMGNGATMKANFFKRRIGRPGNNVQIAA